MADNRFSPGRSTYAFTRTELIIVLVVVGGLVALLVMPHLKELREKSTTTRCADNLAKLGVGFAGYAKDHGGDLPPGRLHYSDQNQIAWDTLIKPYVQASLRATNAELAAATRDRGLESLFLCPADTIGQPLPTGGKEKRLNIKNLRRSYAMPAHNMGMRNMGGTNNWPPGPKNATGVGLTWTFGPLGDKPPSERIWNKGETNKQAAVNLSMIREPGDTLMVTELVRSNNFLWKTGFATIRTTSEHLDTNAIPMAKFHDGKFNYLMVDGHVETLYPKQTVGHLGEAGTNVGKHFGMWTIKTGD